MEDLVDASTALISCPISRASNCCSAFGCLPYFFAGILVLALVEFLCVLYLLVRLLSTKPTQNPNRASSLKCTSDGGVSTSSLQGNLWVAPLPEGDLSKISLQKSAKDKEIETEKKDANGGLKRGIATKDLLEIAPVQRHAVLKEGVLLLKGTDGREEQIALEGCEVVSISAGSSSSGKWARRFPIMLQHPTRPVYGKCKGCVFYAESGYEKESWCEVLRANVNHPKWLTEIKEEYKVYTDRAEKHVSYLNRFHSGRKSDCLRVTSKEDKLNDFNSEESASKRRLILKKLLRRGTKTKEKSLNDKEELGNSTRSNCQLSREQEEGSSWSVKENVITGGLGVSKSASCAIIESIARSESTSSESDVEKFVLGVPQDDKQRVELLAATMMHGHENGTVMKEFDQGQLCLNMIVARLFFDFYHSNTRKEWIQHQFQKLLSRIKTPSYIKSITIKEFDLGKEPPFATALRMLPADAHGALTMEVDLEWHGGCFIILETRVDTRDQNAQDKMASHLEESGSTGDATVALLSGIGEDLRTPGLSEVSSTLMNARQIAASKTTGAGDDSSKRGGWMQSVKAMISHVADQVSQVALLLKIRLVSVKGTCIISLRAPPSDRLWFSFKDMPDIDLVPEPGIGDRRFKNGPLGNFIANQIKLQIREQIVMPYFQDLLLDWMMSDKDDWLPRSAFPVAFTAVQYSENERLNSKHDPDMPFKPNEEKGKSSLTRSRSSNADNNGEDKLEIRQVYEQSGLPSIGSPYGPPITVAQPPTNPQSLNNHQTSGMSRGQSRKSTISERSSCEHSLPIQPQGAPVRSISSLPTREEKEYDFKKPFLDADDRSGGNSLEPDGRTFADASERAVGVPNKDNLQQSESSALKREPQHPPNQVPDLEHSEEEPSNDSDLRESRRARLAHYSKKIVEKRRIIIDKLRDKIAEGSEGGSSRHSGSGRK